MNKTVSTVVTSDGIFQIEWGGDLEGQCCGYEETRLKEKLKQLGIELNLQSVFCRLPKENESMAKNAGICIQGFGGGKSNG